jgi:hypothetical protein
MTRIECTPSSKMHSSRFSMSQASVLLKPSLPIRRETSALSYGAVTIDGGYSDHGRWVQ